MNALTKTWIFLLLLLKSNCDILNYRFVKDYLLWKNIKVILFVTCSRSNCTENNKNPMVNFKSNNIWINLWDMTRESNLSNFDYNHFLLRSGYPFCVIVDWTCSETPIILGEISKRKMFHYERHWLVFGGNAEEMLDVLSQELINIDAEVAVVVPVGDT